MPLIDFNIPKKIRSTEEHNKKYSSDSGVAGTYVPNMSVTDMNKWKGKHIKGNDERIEVRKTINGTQLLIVIFKNQRFTPWEVNRDEWRNNHKEIRLSMNGKAELTFSDFEELKEVVSEAKTILGI